MKNSVTWTRRIWTMMIGMIISWDGFSRVESQSIIRDNYEGPYYRTFLKRLLKPAEY